MVEMDDAAMRMLTRMALEEATESLAKFAEQFAKDPLMKVSTGEQALTAFAAAIRSNNAKVWPKEGRGS